MIDFRFWETLTAEKKGPHPQEDPLMLKVSARFVGVFAAILGFSGLIQPAATAQEILTANQLTRMTTEQLLDLYRTAPAVAIPPGKLAGRALVRPGSRFSPVLSRAAGLIWQGKVFGEDATVVNRFFGVRVIRARVYHGESWLDGGPTLVLDHRETSRIYARFRDEIREVAPGLYLGLMYDRKSSQPQLTTLFALEARR